MNTHRANGNARPKTRIAPTAGKGDTGFDLGKTAIRNMRVRCPNPACNKVHVLNSDLAQRKGRCSCGVVFRIPAAKVATATSHAVVSSRQSAAIPATVHRAHTQEPAPHQSSEVQEVHIGCIGRGMSGKSVLFHSMADHFVGDFFLSGLSADAGDPREVARMIRETEEVHRLLRHCGLQPTDQALETRCCLYDGDEQRVVYKMREVIGQILTHTLPDSAPNLQARYGEYLKNLVNTHVLWVLVPCPPPSPTAADRRRYGNDLRISLAYLREAVRLRPLKQPAAVALVLSKIDTLFEDAEEARASLTDDVLLDVLGPLVTFIEKSKRVSEAVIAPVTVFGFGNAVLPVAAGAQSEAELVDAEPVWLLREDATPEPFNVDGLFLWTLLAGVVHSAGPQILEAESDLGSVCRKLRGDLEAIDPWLVPIKAGRMPD